MALDDTVGLRFDSSRLHKSLDFYIKEALIESQKSDVDIKIGACLFSSTGLFVRGTNVRSVVFSNRPYLDSIISELEYTTHAEIICVLRALGRGFDFSIGEWEIVVASLRSDGSWRDTEPCEICKRVLKLIGIKRVYFYLNGKLQASEF